jgi:hypothetical protein
MVEPVVLQVVAPQRLLQHSLAQQLELNCLQALEIREAEAR